MQYNEEKIDNRRKGRPMDKLLYIIVAIAVPVALLLAAIIAMELRKLLVLANLYRSRSRDMHFVSGLVGLYLPGKKRRMLVEPCLLTNDSAAPANADLVILGGKGVMILTVDERTGHFSTPPTGSWTLWDGGKGSRIPNRFNEGWQYATVINRIMAENGISCPVYNHIVLSDDDVRIDDLYSDNVFTGAQLVPYVKWFCRGRDLSPKKQKKLRAALLAHHDKCTRAIEEAKRKAAAEKAANSVNLLESLLGNSEIFPDNSEK